jgi:hypothetical protein
MEVYASTFIFGGIMCQLAVKPKIWKIRAKTTFIEVLTQTDPSKG